MKAVVLCGGFGTRLGEITREMPKPLLDVAGRPFLDYVLSALTEAGVQDVTLAVSFQREKIAAVYSENWRGVRIRYSVEDEPLGTGGAIRQAMDVAGARQALVLNGDTLFKMDLRSLAAFHAQHDGDATVAVRNVPDVSRYGAVTVADDGRILRFGEKKAAGCGLINAGVYIVEATVFDGIETGPFSFEQRVLTKVEEHRLYGMEATGYFIDIGVPEDLARAARDLA